jgi:arsenate reductase
MTANWGMSDPVAIQGSPEEVERAFVQAFTDLRRRINVFLSLPISTLDSLSLQKRLDDIGKN